MADATLRALFPDEFNDSDNSQITLIKRIAEFELKMISGKISRVKKARYGKELDFLYKELNKEIDQNLKTIDKKGIELMQNFQELCFIMSKLDGTMTFQQIEALSVTKFYQLKQFLMKINKKTAKKTNEE
jgi:hypothetical protein